MILLIGYIWLKQKQKSMKKILLSAVLSIFFYNGFSQCVPAITNDCFAVANIVDSVVVTNALVNFSNDGTDCSGQDFNFAFYKFKTATATLGNSFDLRVALNSSFPSFMGVWIDWNDDLVFSPTEQVFLSTGTITAMSINVPVPLTAVQDTVLMRIRSASTLTDACNAASSGETEDYNILLVNDTRVENLPSNLLAWSIFPNPAADKLNINIDNFNENLDFKLTDIIGNIVLEDKINSTNFVLDVSKLQRGIYLLSIDYKGEKQVKKIVLE